MSAVLTSRTVAWLLAGILALTIGATQARGDILIDDPSGTNAPASINLPPGGTYFANNPTSWTFFATPSSPTNINVTVAEAANIPGVISGWGRSTTVAASGVSAAFPVEAAVNSGLLAINTGAATNMTLTYNGGTPTSTPQNFTGTTSFTFFFNSSDHSGAPVVVTIEDNTGKTETATASINFTGPGEVVVPLSAFGVTPGFDFSNLSQFQTVIDGGQDLNYRISVISAQTPGIPEPSSLVIWAMMAVFGGWGLLRTRRNGGRGQQPK